MRIRHQWAQQSTIFLGKISDYRYIIAVAEKIKITTADGDRDR
jgi:hypothetical protein